MKRSLFILIAVALAVTAGGALSRSSSSGDSVRLEPDAAEACPTTSTSARWRASRPTRGATSTSTRARAIPTITHRDGARRFARRIAAVPVRSHRQVRA